MCLWGLADHSVAIYQRGMKIWPFETEDLTKLGLGVPRDQMRIHNFTASLKSISFSRVSGV